MNLTSKQTCNIFSMNATNRLVLRVNEIYHDLEGELYHEKHDDIFDGEKDRWSEISKQLFSSDRAPMTFLDVGTGTGFVPLTISRYLRGEDTFICTDISQNILNAAERNLTKGKGRCRYRFLKVDGERFIGVEDSSVDCVTVNSVMHHLPDFRQFFLELERIVKSGGSVIIGHEPNQLFFRNRFLWRNYASISFFFNPAQAMYRIAKFFRLLSIVRVFLKKTSSGKPGEYEVLVQKVNTCLLREKVVNKPLSGTELSALIDFQSPTAGGYDADKGIDISDLLNRYGKSFSLELYETYNHVYRISHRNWLLRKYSRLLSYFFPREGAAFFAIMRKREAVPK